MNKKELVKQISDETAFTQKQIDEIIKSFVKIVSQNLIKREETKLIGFGTFALSDTKEGQHINPKTKQFITIPAKTVPVFRYSNELKKEVSK